MRTLAPGLTNADAIAWAIVGAARSYGDDPVLAMAPTTPGAKRTRAVPAAIVALATRRGDLVELCQVLRHSRTSVKTSKVRAAREPPAPFNAAVKAARDTVEAAANMEARKAWAAGDEVGPIDSSDPPPAPEPRVLVGPLHRPVAAPAFEHHGPAVSRIRPPVFLAVSPAPAPGTLRAQILAALTDRPLNAQNLATLLGAKELLVGQTLNMMRQDGQVTSDPPNGVTRAHRWSLPAGTAAAE